MKTWQGPRSWCPDSTHGAETLPSYMHSPYGMSCCSSLVSFCSPFIAISAQCLTASSSAPHPGACTVRTDSPVLSSAEPSPSSAPGCDAFRTGDKHRKALRLRKISSTAKGFCNRFSQRRTASAPRSRRIVSNNGGSGECYHFVIRADSDGAGSLAVTGVPGCRRSFPLASGKPILSTFAGLI